VKCQPDQAIPRRDPTGVADGVQHEALRLGAEALGQHLVGRVGPAEEGVVDVEQRRTDCGVEFDHDQPVGVDAAAALLTVMERGDAELLVIGIRHRSPVGKLLLGSTEHQLLLECPKPVLAMKPPHR